MSFEISLRKVAGVLMCLLLWLLAALDLKRVFPVLAPVGWPAVLVTLALLNGLRLLYKWWMS